MVYQPSSVYNTSGMNAAAQGSAALQESGVIPDLGMSSMEHGGGLRGLSYVDKTTDIVSIMDRLANIDASDNMIEFSSSQSQGSDGIFTMGDFKRLWNNFAPGGDADIEDSKSDLGMAMYLAASDVMAHISKNSGAFEPRWTISPELLAKAHLN